LPCCTRPLGQKNTAQANKNLRGALRFFWRCGIIS